MKRNQTGEGSAKAEFVKVAEGLGHPSYIFMYSREGKKHCLHIQPRHADAVRKAIENGRALEQAILDEGLAFIERLREQD